MQMFLGNQDVTLVVPLISPDGIAIDASAVQYRVINQNETELVAKTTPSAFMTGDTEVEIAIPGLVNSLGVSALRELRIIELYVTGITGLTKLSVEYMIEADVVLVAGINSFQSYPSALMVGYETPNIDAWSSAGKNERINGLTAARRNIGRVAMRYALPMNEIDGTRLVATSQINTGWYGDITTLTAEQFTALPADFKAALCRAQVIEADFLLGGDAAGDIRRSGVMSSTVGESSQFFRTTKPLEGAVCKRAMQELSRYVVVSKRIGRG